MRVLFITSSFLPRIGGVERHVYEVSQQLVRLGYTVSIITEQGLERNINKNPNYQSLSSSDNEAKSSKEAYKSIYFIHKKWKNLNLYYFHFGKQNWIKKFRIWMYLLKNKNLLSNADVIHCHDVFIWYLPFRFIFPKKPVYTTFHGYETRFPPSRKSIVIRKISEKLSWGNICIGEFIKRWYNTKTDIITYGAPTVSPFKDYRISKKGSSRGKKGLNILFLGRLEPDTGLPMYLDTLSVLKDKIDFSFEVCGDGSLRKDSEKWGKVHGMVEDVSRYLEQADIVFASSYLSIINAMSYKKPVFSAYNNKLKEDYLRLTPFAKYISIEKDPEVLSEEIIAFLKDPKQKKEQINKAFEWAKIQTWEKIAKKYIELWKQ